MATVGELTVKIGADTAELRRAVDQASGTLRDMGRKMQQVGKTLSTYVTLPLAGIGAASVKAAADAEEMQGKFNAVFQDMSGDVEAWAASHGDAINRSRFDLMEYASSLQDTFVPMGVAREEAAQLSKEMTELAVDLASFNNESEPETVNRLTSALVGNHRAVRSYGVVLTQATLNQELLNMGIEGGVEAATEQQKMFARMNLILEDTADAHGDAERTAGSFTNQMRGLRSAVKELAIEIGEELIPMLQPLIARVKEATKWFSELDDATQTVIVSVGILTAALGPLLVSLGTLATLVAAINWPVTLFIAGVTALGGAIYGLIKGVRVLIDKLGSLRDRWNDLKDLFFRSIPGGTVAAMLLGVDTSGPQNVVGGGATSGAAAALGLGGLEEMMLGIGESADEAKDSFHDFGTAAQEAGQNASEAVSRINHGVEVELKDGVQSATAATTDLVGEMDKLPQSLERLNATAQRTLPELAESTKLVLHGIQDAVRGLSDSVGMLVSDLVTDTGNAFKNFGRNVIRVIQRVIDRIVAAMVETLAWQAILSAFGGGGGFIGSVITAAAPGNLSRSVSAAGVSSRRSQSMNLNLTSTTLPSGDVQFSVQQANDHDRRAGRE